LIAGNFYNDAIHLFYRLKIRNKYLCVSSESTPEINSPYCRSFIQLLQWVIYKII